MKSKNKFSKKLKKTNTIKNEIGKLEYSRIVYVTIFIIIIIILFLFHKTKNKNIDLRKSHQEEINFSFNYDPFHLKIKYP